jgi:senataxin
MSSTDFQNEYWNENTLVCFFLDKIELIGMITSIRRKGNIYNLETEVHISGKNSDLAPEIKPKTQWRAKCIMKMNTFIREFEGIANLSKLYLHSTILNPQKESGPSISDSLVEKYSRNLQLNEPQARAVAAVIGTKSGFVLIQGPPGTGKTKTILGIIGALQNIGNLISVPTTYAGTNGSNSVSRRKNLLVCAPSNAAVDEIARRIMPGIIDSSGKLIKPKILRVGNTSSIHPDILPVSLSRIVDDTVLAKTNEPSSNSKEIETLTMTMKTLQESGGHSEKEINQLMDEIKKLRNSKEKNKESDLRSNLYRKLVLDADIILCTLSGAGTDALKHIHGLQFETVIIDESCQAVEPSTLIPLRHSCTKCILVGGNFHFYIRSISIATNRSFRYSYNQEL